jgi:hypothetical protein
MALEIATAMSRAGSLKPPRLPTIEKSFTKDVLPLKRIRSQFQWGPFNGQPYRKNGRLEEDYSELARKYGRCFQRREAIISTIDGI